MPDVPDRESTLRNYGLWRAAQRPDVDLTCAECGAAFTGKRRAGPRYCSDTCRVRAYDRRTARRARADAAPQEPLADA